MLLICKRIDIRMQRRDTFGYFHARIFVDDTWIIPHDGNATEGKQKCRADNDVLITNGECRGGGQNEKAVR